MFGTAAFGEAMFAEQSDRDMSLPFSTHTPWILQVRTRAGVMLHRLDGWFNCQEHRRLNQPGTLSFSIPLEHPVVATGDLAGPNEIWTVDGAGIVQHKYYIQEERARLDVQGNTYNIRATGYLKFLSDETFSISLADAVTVEDAVDAIVAQFGGTPPITKGYLEPVIAQSGVDLGDASFQSLLSVLNTIRESGVGGWFEVDNEREINWRTLRKTFPEQIFQLPDNLMGYEEKTQRGEIFNRIFATGGVVGTGTNKFVLQLDSPGYLEDAASISTYDRRTKLISNPTIRTLAQLTGFAQNFLDQHKDPPVQRTLPSIDLSMLQQDPDNLTVRVDSIVRLGATATLKPPVEIPGSPVPFNANVFGFARTLDDPLSVTIEFDEEEVDIFRMLAIAPGGDTNTTNITNQFGQDIEDLWQEFGNLVIPDEYTDLNDTPSLLGNGGELQQVNEAGNALEGLPIGDNAGMRLTPNTGGTALEWVNFIQYTGANKAALGTPPIPALGMIDTAGDNRLMWWDAEAVANENSDNWRDVTSFGKKTT